MGNCFLRRSFAYLVTCNHLILGMKVARDLSESGGLPTNREWMLGKLMYLGFGVEPGHNAAQDRFMERGDVISKLREHQGELRAAGIVHLLIFGSVARGEASAVSDVDLIAEFDKSKRLTLVKVGSLQSRLTELLGVNVDLSSPEWMREPVRSQALREAVSAF